MSMLKLVKILYVVIRAPMKTGAQSRKAETINELVDQHKINQQQF